MKKYIAIFIALLCFHANATYAKGGKQKASKELVVTEAGTLFLFGVALNPTDSVVYITDELLIENTQVYKKSKFLVNRDDYSYQLRDYMTSQGIRNRTCSITYAKSINALDKKYKKQVARFQKRGYLIQHVDQGVFRFKTVRTEEEK